MTVFKKSNNPKTMSSTITNLREFLYSPFRTDASDWNESFQTILNFQSDDGSFRTTNSRLPDSDVREEFIKYPTMLGSAILMKAFLLFPEKQETILPRLKKALDAAAHMGLYGHGYGSLDGDRSSSLICS